MIKQVRTLRHQHGPRQYICVRISLNSWLEQIETTEGRDHPVRCLYYQIIDASFRECQTDLRDLDAELYEKISRVIDSKDFIPRSDFVHYLRQIARRTGRKLCIALDEGERIESKQSFQDLSVGLNMVIATALQQDCSLVLARCYKDDTWRKVMATEQYGYSTSNAVATPSMWRTSLCLEDETRDHFDRLGITFTELAHRTLWHFTGGYQYLLQVLGAYSGRNGSENGSG